MLAIISIFACLFALSVGATAIDQNSTFTLQGNFVDVNGNSVSQVNLYDSDGDALIWYLNTDGKLVSDKAANLISVSEAGVASFSNQAAFYQKSARAGVVVVNLRSNVKNSQVNYDGEIKHFGNEGDNDIANRDTNCTTGFQFGGYNVKNAQIQGFYFPMSAESILRRMFQNTPVRIADIEPGTPISDVGINAFYGAKNLTSILIPNDIVSFKCKDGEGAFTNCTSLATVVFEENSILRDGGMATFYNCSSLTSLILPNSVETVGRHFLRGCSSLVEFSFGANFKYITVDVNIDRGNVWIFYSCSSLKRVYMPATLQINNPSYEWDKIFSNAGNCTYFITGDKDQAEAIAETLKAAGDNDSFTSAYNSGNKLYSYSDYIAKGGANKISNCVVYNYSPCDAFYNSSHSYQNEAITYTSYAKNGVKHLSGCTNEGCIKEERIDAPALFTCLGYSVPNDGGDEIVVGYEINLDAMAEYKSYLSKMEKTLTLGVFAGLKATLLENDVFTDGKTTEGVITAEVSSDDYVSFELRMTGVKDEYKNEMLAMGAYVIEKDEASTKYTYETEGTPSEGENYFFISYNDVLNATK